eukprot:6194669-Alexandrium_andersonii.AAC.1
MEQCALVPTFILSRSPSPHPLSHTLHPFACNPARAVPPPTLTPLLSLSAPPSPLRLPTPTCSQVVRRMRLQYVHVHRWLWQTRPGGCGKRGPVVVADEALRPGGCCKRGPAPVANVARQLWEAGPGVVANAARWAWRPWQTWPGGCGKRGPAARWTWQTRPGGCGKRGPVAVAN